MDHPGFFARTGPHTLQTILEATGTNTSQLVAASSAIEITDIRPLKVAQPGHLSFLDNHKYRPDLKATKAAACFVKEADRELVPEATTALITADPYRAFARALALFYPDALRPDYTRAATTAIDPTAKLEDDVVIEPGAIIGPEAHIGAGTRICAGAVIGYRVHVGRGCSVGPNATLGNALVGDHVIIHAGARIGQDGFGFAMGSQGHLKVPQIGRVILQDHVEIGANTSIDRGALSDTIIGEGSKIDNLVQIGHNVVMGRHCIIVAQTGISGSTELGDFVVMGGQSGAVGHIQLGAGAQVAGASHVKDNLAPGSRVGGTPARPLRQWARELAAITRLARARGKTRQS